MPLGGRGEEKRRRAVLLRLLREVRIEAGMRQVDVAKALRKPQSFVSNYESGERRLDVLELKRLCDVLGVRLVEFAHRLESALASKAGPSLDASSR